jgi:hypothetical protein
VIRPFNKNLPHGVVNGETANNVRYTQGGIDYDNDCKPCENQSQGIEPFNPDIVLAKALGSAQIDNEAVIEAEVQARLAAAMIAAGLDAPVPSNLEETGKDPLPKGSVVKSTTTVMAPDKMDADQLKSAVEFKGGVYTNRKAALKFLAGE